MPKQGLIEISNHLLADYNLMELLIDEVKIVKECSKTLNDSTFFLIEHESLPEIETDSQINLFSCTVSGNRAKSEFKFELIN